MQWQLTVECHLTLPNLECYCDGSFVTCVQGNGLIRSTTSGSTAYSLAAGGSMVHPQVDPHIVSRFCSALQYCVKALQKCVGYSFSLFYIYYVLTLLNNLKDAHVQAPKDTAVVINLLSLFTRNLSSTWCYLYTRECLFNSCTNVLQIPWYLIKCN